MKLTTLALMKYNEERITYICGAYWLKFCVKFGYNLHKSCSFVDSHFTSIDWFLSEKTVRDKRNKIEGKIALDSAWWRRDKSSRENLMKFSSFRLSNLDRFLCVRKLHYKK